MALLLSRGCETFLIREQGSPIPAISSKSTYRQISCRPGRGRWIGGLNDESSRVLVVATRELRRPIAVLGSRSRRGKREQSSQLKAGSLGNSRDSELQSEIMLENLDVGLSYGDVVDSKRLRSESSRGGRHFSDETDDCSGYVCVQEVNATQSGSRGEEQREDDKESSNCGSEFKNEDGNVRTGMTGVADRGAIGDGEDSKTVVLERKQMGRPRKKKKKAYNAGIAIYDIKLQAIRLKKEVAPEVVHVFPVRGDLETEQASQEILLGNKKPVSEASLEYTGWKESGLVHIGRLEQTSGVVPLSANSGSDKGGRKDISKNSPTGPVYRAEESISTSILPGFKKDRSSRQNRVNEFGGTDTVEGKVDRSRKNRTEVRTHAEVVMWRTTLLELRKPRRINDVRSMQRSTLDVLKTTGQLESQEAMRKPPARSNTDDDHATNSSVRSQSAGTGEVISGKNFTKKANSVAPLPQEGVKEPSPQPTPEGAVQQPTSSASKRKNQFKSEGALGYSLRKPVRSISTNNGSASDARLSSARLNSHDSRSATSQSSKGTSEATKKLSSQLFDLPVGQSNLPADVLRNSYDVSDRIDVSATLEPADSHAATSFACKEQPSIPSSQGAMKKPSRTLRDLPQTQIELPADKLRKANSRSDTEPLKGYDGTQSVAPLPSDRMKNNCNNSLSTRFNSQSAVPFSLDSMKRLVSELEVVPSKQNNHPAGKSIEADGTTGTNDFSTIDRSMNPGSADSREIKSTRILACDERSTQISTISISETISPVNSAGELDCTMKNMYVKNDNDDRNSDATVTSLPTDGFDNASGASIAYVGQSAISLPMVMIQTSQSIEAQVIEPVLEALPEFVIEQVGQIVHQVESLKVKVVEPIMEVLPEAVVEQVGQVVEQTAQSIKEQVVEPVLEVLPEAVVEQVSQVVHQVASQVNEQVQQVSTTATKATETLTSTAAQVAESISSTAVQVTESITTTAAQVSNSLSLFLEEDIDGDDEFEAFKTSDLPEFRGLRGLENYQVQQEDQGILARMHDFYSYMLKQPLPLFSGAMLAAPIVLSMVFTFLYLPQFQGLAHDETARKFLESASGLEGERINPEGLKLSWATLFEVFMFSLSLSTGLQPELAPLSPYALMVANLNALIAQLIFVFLSGAVFARLSQPSQPVRCSTVALVCNLGKHRRQADSSANKALMVRCVLAGPQPCELVDVKVDLMYKFNTVTPSGSYFRGSQSLKLVRPEISFLNHGMLVRHIIDESSPLLGRTSDWLCQDDAIFVLSIAGMERTSMESVFHVQYYSVYDGHVIWNAEFEDMLLINQKNRRILDHSKLSSWRPL